MVSKHKAIFPFTAIVGQEDMKLALILNVIDPNIGGVLIRGDKGTGKSTAVRALAALLPELEFSEGCPFNCDPNDRDLMCETCREKYDKNKLKKVKRKMEVVEIPLGVTEDRVVGSLDIEKAIKKGVKALEAGILARANRNILYVDEINLLSNHIVDDLLDSAAMGTNTVEREGISVSHPANFILVGSMNPEEGELRPQILDRMGLHIEVTPLRSEEERVEIMRRVKQFDSDPQKFREMMKREEELLRERIINAQKLLPKVEVPEFVMKIIAKLCLALGVGTHRGDITVMRCARAIAAYEGRTHITDEDIIRAARLALTHRIKQFSQSSEEVGIKIREQYEKVIENIKSELGEGTDEESEEGVGEGKEGTSDKEGSDETQSEGEKKGENKKIQNPYQTWIEYYKQLQQMGLNFPNRDDPSSYARRVKLMGTADRGKYVQYRIPKEKPRRIALDASIRASSIYQKNVNVLKKIGKKLHIRNQDVREKVLEYRAPLSIVFVADSSGSMYNKMHLMKNAILSMHTDAYRKKDRVGLVAFSGRSAELLHEPSVNLDAVAEKVAALKPSSWTPLAKGVALALEVLRKEKMKNKDCLPYMIIATDGEANIPLGNSSINSAILKEIEELSHQIKKEGIKTMIFFFPRNVYGTPFIRFGMKVAATITRITEGKLYSIDDLGKITEILP